MEVKRGEGGRIEPFINTVTDGFHVVNPRAEGMTAIYSPESIMLAELLRGIEYLSQQIYEKGE